MKQFISIIIGQYLNLLAITVPRRAAKMGFALFCHPFRSKLAAHHHAFFDSAEKFSFESGGDTIQAYRWGRGRKNVLLLHGWQSHAFRWKKYVEAFDESEYSVYAIDAPGHGLSTGKAMTVPLYSQAIEKLLAGVGDLHAAIGHSIGGFTAVYTFYRKPELSPRKLVVMAAPGEAQEFFQFFKTTLGLTARTLKLTAEQFEKTIGHPPGYFSAPFFARHLDFPGLIVHATHDAETPVENARRLYAAWRKAELALTKGSDHNLRSPEVMKQVLAFVEAGDTTSVAATANANKTTNGE
ncbi:MAG: alpha/beta hydrolase [Cytophagales bacterium]|jgi:pimeloyl-ACP methyl ester carboxylesterase|nr:alpha/beta hydrolase [Cytophagales bacterium]